MTRDMAQWVLSQPEITESDKPNHIAITAEAAATVEWYSLLKGNTHVLTS